MDAFAGRIIIVEDEVNIRAGLRDILQQDGHTITGVGSGEEALATLAAAPCDAAVVDIRMPGITGIELLRQIHTRWPHVAVIILTGHGDLESAMAAIKAGAHDYLLKPAAPDAIRQTVMQAVAASRRRKEQARLLESLRGSLGRLDGLASPTAPAPASSSPAASFTVGGLCIDFRAHEVRRDGKPVRLSPTEFKLLAILSAHPGEVVDYATLARLSLGYEAELWEAKELLKRHVFSVRHKIEPDPAAPLYLLNVRGVGYRLASPQVLE
ncbi:MAG: response regulator transcription factor [Anaerolineae bacterium]